MLKINLVLTSVGAKANVLHCVGFGYWDAALLILLKRWHFVFHFSVRYLTVVSFFRVAHNGSRLCVVADLDALHCQPTKMLIRCTKLQFCTEPAITQNRCCAFVVLFCPLYSRSILLLLGSHTLCQVLVCVSARATWQCVWLVGWF